MLHRPPSLLSALLKRPLQAVAVTTITLLGAFAISCGAADETGPSASGAVPRQESGDTAAATDTTGTGGVLRVAMSAGNIPIPDQFPTEGGEGRRFVGVNVYDALVNWNSEQGDTPPEPVPGLAESWTRSDDNLTWTFTLRKGVKFHDGSAFTADSVVFAFDRLMNKDFEFYSETQRSAGASNIAQIASYEKVDDFTVRFVTKKPWAFFLYDLATYNIPSPTAIKQWGNKDYPQHASGTGPFKIVKYVDGQVLELEKNTDYWGGAPKLDKLILYPMPEPATRLAALQSGQVDWAEVPPPDSIEQLQAEGYNVLLKGYPHNIVYMLNMYRPPFDNVKVRQALAYGIDREGIVSLIRGVGQPATQYFYPGHPWRDESFEGYSYDPAKAKALLAEAGYPNGIEISIAYPTGGSGNMFPGPMNEKFQQDMRAIGVNVTLVPLEWNNIITAYRAGFANPDYSKYDGLYFSPNTQAPLFAFASYLTERIPPAGCCNPMGYSSPEADAVFAKAAATFEKAEQDKLLAEFQGTFIRDAPAIPVVHDLNLRVLSPKVRGWVQPQSWWGNFKSVWMKE
jgi:peptide/nickel transport system substrate-binding protein